VASIPIQVPPGAAYRNDFNDDERFNIRIMIISVLEIALLLMLPLVVFYQRSIWSYKKYLPGIMVIYLIWYLSYAPFHELMHLLGVWLFTWVYE
jgi:hypothetical protein